MRQESSFLYTSYCTIKRLVATCWKPPGGLNHCGGFELIQNFAALLWMQQGILCHVAPSAWETASLGSVLLFECGPRVKQRQGSNDCGCFAIVICYVLCKGKDPAKHRPEQSKLRDYILSCFEERKLGILISKLLLVQLGLTFCTYKLPVSPCTCPGCLVAKWLKRWTTDPGVPGFSPTRATGILSPRSLLSSAQKCEEV